jgi:hypothetical protein
MQTYRDSGISPHNILPGYIVHVTMYVCVYGALHTTSRFVALNINGHEYTVETHGSCDDINKENLSLIVFRKCLLFKP